MSINNRGSILILSFWALIVLGVLGLGISRRVDARLALTRYQIRKTQARYAAFAGLSYVIEQIRNDLNNKDTRDADTAYNCGLALEDGMTPQEIFEERPVGNAVFSVKTDVTGQEQFGLEDESGRLNINALTEVNYGILKELLLDLDVSEEQAETIASSVIDWKDANQSVFHEDFGAEQDYYQQLGRPHDCKDRYFESVEELLLVRGMTPEIFEQLRRYVTVFPLWGSLRVNFSAAPRPVLSAMARSVTGARTGTNELDAESFVRKVIEFRDGSDGTWGTSDDQPFLPGQGPSFSGPEIAISAALASVRSAKAYFIRARIEAYEKNSGVKAFLEAVIQTDTLAVVSLSVR